MKKEGIQLSIVIASWNGTASLLRCLESIENRTDKSGEEVIVVSNFLPDLPENGPSADFYVRPDTYTVPELRRDGIKVANGNVIALIEDHCTVHPEWSREIKKAHVSKHSVVGGSVENATIGSALDWAVYFYDYGDFMLPNRSGVTKALSGLNVSYKRDALKEIDDIYEDGFFETFVNAELRNRGHELSMIPSAIVYHNKKYDLKHATAQCYHLARSFAAQRVASSNAGRRLAFILGSLLLPALLPARIALSVLKKGRNLGRLASSAPFLILLMSFWSYGEFCGYLAGEGTSRGAWR